MAGLQGNRVAGLQGNRVAGRGRSSSAMRIVNNPPPPTPPREIIIASSRPASQVRGYLPLCDTHQWRGQETREEEEEEEEEEEGGDARLPRFWKIVLSRERRVRGGCGGGERSAKAQPRGFAKLGCTLLLGRRLQQIPRHTRATKGPSRRTGRNIPHTRANAQTQSPAQTSPWSNSFI